jgi:signal recognition particle subunit SEC65
VIPDIRFLQQGHSFWANVRAISEKTGYTIRGKSAIKVPSLNEMRKALRSLGLSDKHIVDAGGMPTELGETLEAYFEYRAERLNDFVQPRLMDAERARKVFEQLKAQENPTCPLPLNKQKGEKKAPAYLTGIVNILIEANAEGLPCVHDPRKLTTVTRDRQPLRTLARRVDGAFPSTVNPIAVWEIKEYYYTTTFGSRVADGVYESLLDGLELEELRETEGINVLHYLMVDAYLTWWVLGKSYLCRIVDMLHMGYINEVLFGYEVVERLPGLVKEWVGISRQAIGVPPPA